MDLPQQPPNEFLKISGLPAELVNKLREGEFIKKQDIYVLLLINGKNPKWGDRKIELEAQLAQLVLEKPLPPLGQAAPDEPQHEEEQGGPAFQQPGQGGPALLQPGQPMVPANYGALMNMPNAAEEEFRCMVCMDRRIEYIFHLCNHLGICNTCKGALTHQAYNIDCPYCRTPHNVHHIRKVYLVTN